MNSLIGVEVQHLRQTVSTDARSSRTQGCNRSGRHGPALAMSPTVRRVAGDHLTLLSRLASARVGSADLSESCTFDAPRLGCKAPGESTEVAVSYHGAPGR